MAGLLMIGKPAGRIGKPMGVSAFGSPITILHLASIKSNKFIMISFRTSIPQTRLDCKDETV